MLKVGASRLSLVEIYVHGCYHVWIMLEWVKQRNEPRSRYRQVSQSDAGQMSDGCFLVVFLINEGLLGKIRTTKRHGLESTTWKMATWDGGKRVRRQTATIATSPNTMVKYWQRHGFLISFFEISDLLFNKFNVAPLRSSYNRGLLNYM